MKVTDFLHKKIVSPAALKCHRARFPPEPGPWTWPQNLIHSIFGFFRGEVPYISKKPKVLTSQQGQNAFQVLKYGFGPFKTILFVRAWGNFIFCAISFIFDRNAKFVDVLLLFWLGNFWPAGLRGNIKWVQARERVFQPLRNLKHSTLLCTVSLAG